MIYWHLFLLQFICVCVIDVSGAVDDMLTPLFKRITGSRIGHIGKPLNCSTCMTFWTGLFYLLCVGALSLPNIAFLLGLAILTPVTYLAVCLVKDTLTKIIEFFYNVFGL